MSKRALFTAALLASSHGAFAQTVPNAGTQLRQIPPAPERPPTGPIFRVEPRAVEAETGPAGATVQVNALHVTGETLFSEADLIAASGFTPGSRLSLADLRALAARISAFYNEHGYFLTQAYLPPQDISAGAVTIAVVEGHYGAVTIHNNSHLNDAVARARLGGLESGDIVASAPLERRLLLLSDLPGIVVRSTLAPGAAVGTSDLAIAIEPGRRITGSVEADNAGNRYTGAWRLGGSIDFNDPTGIGDRLSARVLASPSGLAYARLAYQAPIGALALGVAYSHLRYSLGREFSSLDADGTADIASLYASYPLLRSRDANLYALGTIEAHWFTDRIRLVASETQKRSQTATLGLAGDSHDRFGGGGWTTASLGWTFGNLDIRTPLDRAIDDLTARSNGRFNEVRFAAARLQTLSGPLSLYASVRGQIAFDNLDSSEKMELGGAYGVRAYPEGEAYGDEGVLATAEARLMLNRWTGPLPGQLQLVGFVDAGQVNFAHDPWFAGTNRARRSGYGVGLNWFGPDNLVVRASYARRFGDQPATSAPDQRGRFWFQVVKLF